MKRYLLTISLIFCLPLTSFPLSGTDKVDYSKLLEDMGGDRATAEKLGKRYGNFLLAMGYIRNALSSSHQSSELFKIAADTLTLEKYAYIDGVRDILGKYKRHLEGNEGTLQTDSVCKIKDLYKRLGDILVNQTTFLNTAELGIEKAYKKAIEEATRGDWKLKESKIINNQVTKPPTNNQENEEDCKDAHKGLINEALELYTVTGEGTCRTPSVEKITGYDDDGDPIVTMICKGPIGKDQVPGMPMNDCGSNSSDQEALTHTSGEYYVKTKKNRRFKRDLIRKGYAHIENNTLKLKFKRRSGHFRTGWDKETSEGPIGKVIDTREEFKLDYGNHSSISGLLNNRPDVRAATFGYMLHKAREFSEKNENTIGDLYDERYRFYKKLCDKLRGLGDEGGSLKGGESNTGGDGESGVVGGVAGDDGSGPSRGRNAGPPPGSGAYGGSAYQNSGNSGQTSSSDGGSNNNAGTKLNVGYGSSGTPLTDNEYKSQANSINKALKKGNLSEARRLANLLVGKKLGKAGDTGNRKAQSSKKDGKEKKVSGKNTSGLANSGLRNADNTAAKDISLNNGSNQEDDLAGQGIGGFSEGSGSSAGPNDANSDSEESGGDFFGSTTGITSRGSGLRTADGRESGTRSNSRGSSDANDSGNEKGTENGGEDQGKDKDGSNRSLSSKNDPINIEDSEDINKNRYKSIWKIITDKYINYYYDKIFRRK